MKEPSDDSHYSWLPWLFGGLLLVLTGWVGWLGWKEDWLGRYRNEGTHCALGPRADFVGISAALKVYRLNVGELPSQEQGLEALVNRPVDLPASAKWTSMAETVPIDPWGNPYHYLRDDSLPGGFGIYSTGPDGISLTLGNDPDDFSSWRK